MDERFLAQRRLGTGTNGSFLIEEGKHASHKSGRL
jgi:hypothetical protein